MSLGGGGSCHFRVPHQLGWQWQQMSEGWAEKAKQAYLPWSRLEREGKASVTTSAQPVGERSAQSRDTKGRQGDLCVVEPVAGGLLWKSNQHL